MKKCNRCGGMMVSERFYSREGIAGQRWEGWRCVNCGDVLDDVVLQHRERRLLKLRTTQNLVSHQMRFQKEGGV